MVISKFLWFSAAQLAFSIDWIGALVSDQLNVVGSDQDMISAVFTVVRLSWALMCQVVVVMIFSVVSTVRVLQIFHPLGVTWIADVVVFPLARGPPIFQS
jgi:hypothetical protein